MTKSQFHFFFSPSNPGDLSEVPPEPGEYPTGLTLTVDRKEALRLIGTIVEAVEKVGDTNDLVQFSVDLGIGEWKAFANADDEDGESVDPRSALPILDGDDALGAPR